MMNDFNFDKMKNFNTPDEWAEKAREIPKKYKKPTPLLFLENSRPLAVAASLVLVCTLSFLFFVFKPDDNILPIDLNTVPSSQTESVTESLNPTEPTYEKGNPQKPDEYVKTEPTESQQSTENNTTESPTQKPTSSTEIVEPTQKPTNSQPSTQPPTDTSTQTPTGNQTEPPTTGAVGDPDPVICFGSYSLSNSWEVNSVDVFCKLYDSNGNLVGDKDLYSYQHEALLYLTTDTTSYVSYEPASKGLLLKSGQYSFYFYDYYGKILSQGYVLVS